MERKLYDELVRKILTSRKSEVDFQRIQRHYSPFFKTAIKGNTIAITPKGEQHLRQRILITQIDQEKGLPFPRFVVKKSLFYPIEISVDSLGELMRKIVIVHRLVTPQTNTTYVR